MKTGTIIGVGVGAVGLGVLGYVLYKKYGQQNATVSAGGGAGTQPQQQNPNILQQGVDLYKQVQQIFPQQSNSPLLTNGLATYEGKGFRDRQTEKIYIVRGGTLHDVLGWSGWDKTGWPGRRYEDLVAAGVIQQVDSAFINSLPKGAALQGLFRTLYMPTSN